MMNFVGEVSKLHFSVYTSKSYYQVPSISDVPIMVILSNETRAED